MCEIDSRNDRKILLPFPSSTLTTAYEQLQALRQELPEKARPALDRWLEAVRANAPIETLKRDSVTCLQEILSFCGRESPLALDLHMANEAIQAI